MLINSITYKYMSLIQTICYSASYLFKVFLWLLLFSLSVMSNSLQPHGLQNARLAVLHYFPEFPQSHVRWVGDAFQPFFPLLSHFHPLFSFFPALGSFPMSWLFSLGGQSIGTSASTSVIAMNIQGLISFRIELCDLLAVQMTLNNLLQTHSSKVSILQRSAIFYFQILTSVYDYWKSHRFIGK